jgi:hypothetical protein
MYLCGVVWQKIVFCAIGMIIYLFLEYVGVFPIKVKETNIFKKNWVMIGLSVLWTFLYFATSASLWIVLFCVGWTLIALTWDYYKNKGIWIKQ